MVEAIVENRKTQTRRPLKMDVKYSENSGFNFKGKDGKWRACGLGCSEMETVNNIIKVISPIKVGDLIWVREIFGIGRYDEEDAEHPLDRGLYVDDSLQDSSIVYKQDAVARGADFTGVKWTPSIHMPKAASRLTLIVESVSIQRLNEITDKDAIKEGRPTTNEAMRMAVKSGLGWYQRPSVWFKSLWDGIYGNWNENPYVLCVEFKVKHQNITDTQ